MTKELYAELCSLSLKIIKNEEKSKDFLHKVLLGYFQNKIEVKNIHGYVKVGIKNHFINEMRSFKKQKTVLTENMEVYSCFGGSPEDLLNKKQSLSEVINFTDTLPEAQKEAFELYLTSGLDLAKTARENGKEPNTFKANYRQAILKYKARYIYENS